MSRNVHLKNTDSTIDLTHHHVSVQEAFELCISHNPKTIISCHSHNRFHIDALICYRGFLRFTAGRIITKKTLFFIFATITNRVDPNHIQRIHDPFRIGASDLAT
ncbi:hypothetical protein MtrunA17_Chr3g0137021 [Medicago truncatula]|uniref:Uncharacterized protein n=1 Tax=Medicago truncatula TaxID=3880 RepID=A0A396J5N8_MEDTR|nr:hypothetical protein MtrunA17_Chr3g0137021 [Medicago truncatula]